MLPPPPNQNQTWDVNVLRPMLHFTSCLLPVCGSMVAILRGWLARRNRCDAQTGVHSKREPNVESMFAFDLEGVVALPSSYSQAWVGKYLAKWVGICYNTRPKIQLDLENWARANWKIRHFAKHRNKGVPMCYYIATLKTCYGCNPDTGIDMTTTSENK